MNQHKLLTGIAIASFLIPSTGLDIIQTNELAVADPIKISKTNYRKPFYSKAGRFSINFPGNPSIRNEKDQDGNNVHLFILSRGQSFYQVSYFDNSYLQNLSRQETSTLITEMFTDLSKLAETRRWDYQLLTSKDIQFNNNIGREVKYTLAGKVVLIRAYILGKRMYTISETKNISETIDPSFLNSFRLQ
jgi:hypothetical protein